MNARARALGLAAAIAGALTLPRTAEATRLAVVIGNDVGKPDEAHLHYAETDARRIAEILTTVGEIAGADTLLLLGRSADEVRATIRQAEDRLNRSGSDGLLFVYYSGHADAEALHLGGSLLPLADLHTMLNDSAVATRVLVIDACRSGAMTHTKGGRAGAGFEISVAPPPNPRGIAVITSSAASEDSQESDELRASFFTHHFASALLGAADLDANGVVTLAEAYSYAARHTVAATAGTPAGPQHPTYRLDLGGREDLVLTRPGMATGGRGGALGRLALLEPGSYVIRREGDSALTAEVSSDAFDRPLALRAGRYEVTRRASDHLMIGTFTVAAASSTQVTDDQMRRVDFGRAVRKGGTSASRAVGIYADGALRGSLLGLGDAAGGGIGARLDLRGVSTTVALDFATGGVDGARGNAPVDVGARAARRGLPGLRRPLADSRRGR